MIALFQCALGFTGLDWRCKLIFIVVRQDPKPVTEEDERPSVYIIKNPGLDLISAVRPEEYLEIDLDQVCS